MNRASLLGGDNYSWGGARARADGSVPGLASQVTDYLFSAGAADGNALYLFNVGGNDVRDILIDGLDANTVINDAVVAIATQVSVLQGSGAQHILFVGVGDVGAIPELVPFGPAAQAAATQLSLAINGAIEGAISPLGAQFFDTIDLFNDILANPALYGLPAGLNTTDACTAALPADFPTCSNYAFIDTIHPTTQIHQVWGDEIVATVVPEPSTALLLSLGLVALATRRKAA